MGPVGLYYSLGIFQVQGALTNCGRRAWENQSGRGKEKNALWSSESFPMTQLLSLQTSNESNVKNKKISSIETDVSYETSNGNRTESLFKLTSARRNKQQLGDYPSCDKSERKIKWSYKRMILISSETVKRDSLAACHFIKKKKARSVLLYSGIRKFRSH